METVNNDVQLEMALAPGLSKFYAKRTPDMIDVVDNVRRLMHNEGLVLSSIEAYDTNELVIAASDKTPEIQRHLLTRYFTRQLYFLHDDLAASHLRSQLAMTSKMSEWLDLIELVLLPFFLDKDLPRVEAHEGE